MVSVMRRAVTTFVALSAALGALPGMLGFPVPDAATVLASGDAPMLDEAGRRAWAGWLVGAMTIYGVLPRLALALLCFVGCSVAIWGILRAIAPARGR